MKKLIGETCLVDGKRKRNNSSIHIFLKTFFINKKSSYVSINHLAIVYLQDCMKLIFSYYQSIRVTRINNIDYGLSIRKIASPIWPVVKESDCELEPFMPKHQF